MTLSLKNKLGYEDVTEFLEILQTTNNVYKYMSKNQ